MDSVSDEALCCGAELVVHAYADGRAPGLARVRELGLDAVTCPAPGTSEDVALLVADAKGASLIVVVGTHHTLEEFLDKGRPGMSSTFITHLRVAGKLVNARGVHQLYQSRISSWSLLVLVLAAAVTVVRRRGVLARRSHLGQVLRSDLAFIHLLADRKILVIDFRYHLVSIVAVFLALAIGIVLGATELQGTTYNVLNRTTGKLQNELNQTRGQLATAQAQAGEGESYAQGVEPAGPARSAVRPADPDHHRAGRAVLGRQRDQRRGHRRGGQRHRPDRLAAEVLRHQRYHPGQPEPDQPGCGPVRRPLAGQHRKLPAAGRAGDSQRDPGQVAEIDHGRVGGAPSAGASSASSPRPVPPASSPSTGNDRDTDAQTMLAAYATSGFLNTTGQPASQATLAVVVTPQTAPSDGTADPLDQVLPPLAPGTGRDERGTVVAGSTAGSGAGSPIAVLRSNNVANQVSTVDDADLALGTDRGDPGARHLGERRQGCQLRVRGQWRERRRPESRAPPSSSSSLVLVPSRPRLRPARQGRRRRRDRAVWPASGIHRRGGRGDRGGRGQVRVLGPDPASARRPKTWSRTNHRGEPVTLLEGPAVAAGAIAGVLAQAGVRAISGSSRRGLRSRVEVAMVLGAVGAAAFGAYDDLAGSGDRRGFRGHLGALRHGEVTTGAVKLGVSAPPESSAPWRPEVRPRTSSSTPGSSPAARIC